MEDTCKTPVMKTCIQHRFIMCFSYVCIYVYANVCVFMFSTIVSLCVKLSALSLIMVVGITAGSNAFFGLSLFNNSV